MLFGEFIPSRLRYHDFRRHRLFLPPLLLLQCFIWKYLMIVFVVFPFVASTVFQGKKLLRGGEVREAERIDRKCGRLLLEGA